MTENLEPEIHPEKRPRVWRWLHKTAVIGGFVWWIIRVVDWGFGRRGLNRVEFPQYVPGKPENSDREEIAVPSGEKKDPA
jgi:hypothetical protein